jgi:phosphoglycerate dehydrogenase-like enzyme
MPASSDGAGLNIFLTGELSEAQLGQIRAAVPAATVRHFASRAEMEAIVEQADIIGGSLSAAALARASRLTWVQSWAAGTNEILYPEMVASPVTVTSCAGNGAVPLAEHAMMLMLMLSRDMTRWLKNQGEQKW